MESAETHLKYVCNRRHVKRILQLNLALCHSDRDYDQAEDEGESEWLFSTPFLSPKTVLKPVSQEENKNVYLFICTSQSQSLPYAAEVGCPSTALKKKKK